MPEILLSNIAAIAASIIFIVRVPSSVDDPACFDLR